MSIHSHIVKNNNKVDLRASRESFKNFLNDKIKKDEQTLQTISNLFEEMKSKKMREAILISSIMEKITFEPGEYLELY